MEGVWKQQDKPGKVFEFKPDHTAINPSKVALKWEERDGFFYVVWKNGNPGQIGIIDAGHIRIGKIVYVKEDAR